MNEERRHEMEFLADKVYQREKKGRRGRQHEFSAGIQMRG